MQTLQNFGSHIQEVAWHDWRLSIWAIEHRDEYEGCTEIEGYCNRNPIRAPHHPLH